MTNKELTVKEASNQIIDGFISSSQASFLGNDEKKLEKLKAGFLYSVTKVPGIMSCTKQSIFVALSQCAQFDLVPGAKGECALIPYGKELTFQPMVAGVIKKAYDSGFVKRIDCEVIHENDHFDYRQGSDVSVTFKKQLFQDRGQVLGAYCVIELEDGSKIIEVMREDEIKKIQGRVKNKHVWAEHWSEMARKTVIKRCLKRVQKSDKLIELVNADNHIERPDYSEQNQAQLDDLNSQLEDVEATDVIDLSPETERFTEVGKTQDDVFDGLPTADDIAEGKNY